MIKEKWARLQRDFESHWNRLYQDSQKAPADGYLHQALSYSVEGSGKRVRPLLCLLACESVGGDKAQAMRAAVAVEMVHVYSLIHDDLPCMDDDDLRRGRPTVHKVFGDAVALLAGDALLTDAFSILADQPLNHEARLQQILILSKAAGSVGMVKGQDLDLAATSKYFRTEVETIHRLKTGCLMGAACALGATAAGLNAADSIKFEALGQEIGLIFQQRDDLLDGRADQGKTPGKDLQQGKKVYSEKHDVYVNKATERLRRAFEPFSSSDTYNNISKSDFFEYAHDLIKREL